MLIPSAVLCHYSDGRIRIRINLKRGDKNYFDLVQKTFSKLPNIDDIKSNPKSGSLLLNTHIAIEKIFEYAQKNNLFIEKKPQKSKNVFSKISRLKQNQAHPKRDKHPFSKKSPSGMKRLANQIYDLDSAIKQSTYGVLDIPTIMFGAFVGMGIYQIARGHVLACGTSLLATAFALVPLQKVMEERVAHQQHS